MTQDAVVTRTFHNSLAEVAVKRSTACGSNCGNCESCVFQNELKVTADNRIGARPGQKVVIESKTSDVLGAAVLVYIVPFVLLFLGYAIGSALGWAEGGCVLIEFWLLCAWRGVQCHLPAQKKASPITFEIIQIRES